MSIEHPGIGGNEIAVGDPILIFVIISSSEAVEIDFPLYISIVEMHFGMDDFLIPLFAISFLFLYLPRKFQLFVCQSTNLIPTPCFASLLWCSKM